MRHLSSFRFQLDEALSLLAPYDLPLLKPFEHLLGASSCSVDEKLNIIVALSHSLLDPRFTMVILRTCRAIMLHLITILCTTPSNHSGSNLLQTVSTFSKILPQVPESTGIILEFMKKSTSILDCLLALDTTKTLDQFPLEIVLEFARTAHRLFRFFCNDKRDIQYHIQWNWASFYTLLKHPHEETRWNAAKTLLLLAKNNQYVTEEILSGICTPENDLKYVRELVEVETFEHNLLFLDTNASRMTVNESFALTAEGLHENLVDVCGILLVKNSLGGTDSSMKRMVKTPTTIENLKALALAVCQRNPILLEGTTGSGKTALIDELACQTGNQDIIKIHLGDQSDAKVLLGTYVCTETPGEFKWQAGALTQAVRDGKWIVIEDIDLASVDVISVILPLLETRSLFIPGRGEEIAAAHGFQIFATETLLGAEGSQSSRGRASGKLLSKFWTKIVVNPLPDDEIITVLEQSFPSLSCIIERFINTFHLLRNHANHQMYGSARPLSARDLMKWVRRVAQFVENEQLVISNAESSELKEIIFSEAYDCFCAMLSNQSHAKEMMKQIALAWNILPDHVDYFIDSYKPSMNLTKTTIKVGRQLLTREKEKDSKKANFALTMHALRNLERICVCVKLSEPVLLVGETGTGKTSVIQHLANQIGKRLVVQNLSQQSDSTDLLGGFKPIELRSLCVPLKNEFDYLFPKTFSRKSNQAFIDKVNLSYASQDWDTFIKLLHDIIKHVNEMQADAEAGDGTRKKTKLKVHVLNRWTVLSSAVNKFIEQRRKISSNFAFAFVEGALVKAVRNGDWVLLDEINLASTETLESLSGLLEGGGLYLTERGDISAVERHPQFRIFACMNPPTDIGKKELPPGLRNRFTEFYIAELTNEGDLKKVVLSYLSSISANPPVEAIVQFYLAAKKEADLNLSDGANQKPHYSLRSLCRSLQYTRDVVAQFGFYRALYEGICMSFLTQLNQKSIPIMERLIHKYIVAELTKKKQNISTVPKQPTPAHIKFSQFWIERGSEGSTAPSDYILTKTINKHLTSLARIVLTRKYPVLLQGPTSSGKTSMVQYLAVSTGHKFVRINNHEHTDIQEYLGCYVSDTKGNLVFQEGILVEAVRHGYWVVLDELNLAPSEVLEALNRLLDDNRELFIPETQETIKPHPHFMLFATQNPPGLYGGRKILSRAFRNRFLELHFDGIPDDELQIILERRCAIAPSYCRKLVNVMKELQRQRHGTKVFAGKNSLITLRDLFRWANRKANGYPALAVDGYMLLAERLRSPSEKQFIKEVLEKEMKVKLNMEDVYLNQSDSRIGEIQAILKESDELHEEFNIVWTYSMKRMFLLLSRCIENQEPVLLIGETGCGKTTVCQLFSLLLKRNIQILNCHQHTETADFLGSLRPIRGKEALAETLLQKLRSFFRSLRSVLDATSLLGLENWNLHQLLSNYEMLLSSPQLLEGDYVVKMEELNLLASQYKSLFEWQDGPLITGMKRGDLFLIDEISLAEDSVLERLNSVLEPERSIVLAEKGASEIEQLCAHNDFRIFATMNPGGDFGKRELSPALRNRFTEIWVPSITAREELIQILRERLHQDLADFAFLIIDFVDWFKETLRGKRLISLRDLLAWIRFMNLVHAMDGTYSYEIYLHGACLVLLDGLPVSTGYSVRRCKQIRSEAFNFLVKQLRVVEAIVPALKGDDFAIQFPEKLCDSVRFGIKPFFISMGSLAIPDRLNFSLRAPTTSNNLMRILRAMQIKKPILLEGSPGVGKTSLVTALATASGHKVVRINLSEQTDMMDLLGTDLPVEGGKPGEFGWSDGVFLRALKEGDWVLLDELNLASQSVLEGLNSCLDHRGTVYIPEIGQEFKCPPSFRIFACQNPTQQGGGRKGLPKSFLNRFTQVYIEQFESEDLFYIATAMYPELPSSLLERMIQFNMRMYEDSMIHSKFGRKGSPWEFNLRDIFRWCDLIKQFTPELLLEQQHFSSMAQQASRFVDLIYLQRMRCEKDREYILSVFLEIFGFEVSLNKNPQCKMSPQSFQIGFSQLPVNQTSIHRMKQPNLDILSGQLHVLENVMKCIEMNWMAILLGGAGSGKTSIVQLLASLLGKPLHQFWMNSSVDTTELLGGFEQIDLVRKKKNLLTAFSKVLDETIEQILLFSIQRSSPEYHVIQELSNQWHIFHIQCKQSSLDQNTNFTPAQIQQIEHLLGRVQQLETYCTSSISRDNLLHSIGCITAQLDQLKRIEIDSVTGCFEWIDGILLQALEAGDWILIDNVNFCNPSVLDRLNPLLESNGSLMVNERGIIDGQVKIIKPHPNFRIFVTMDPDNGEISRAMRNRGIEINLLHSKLTNESDATKLLNKAGIPGSHIPQTMIQFHHSAVQLQHNWADARLGIRELLRWASLTISMLQRGYFFEHSLSESMKQVYLRNQRQVRNQEHIQTLFQEQVIDILFQESTSSESEGDKEVLQDNCGFRAPGLCPSLHRGNHLNRLTTQASFKRGALAYFLASEKVSQCLDAFVAKLQGKNYTREYVLTEIRGKGIPEVYWSTSLLQSCFSSTKSIPFQENSGMTFQAIEALHKYPEAHSKKEFISMVYQTALQTILEGSPVESWNNTVHWIETFLSPLEKSAHAFGNSSLRSTDVVSQILQHPLLIRIKQHTQDLLTLIRVRYLPDQVIDIRTDIPLFHLIHWHFENVSSEPLQQVWNSIEKCTNAFSILIRRMMRDQLEKESSKANSIHLTLIQQAYRYRMQTLRAEPSHTLVPHIHTLFESFDHFVSHLLSNMEHYRELEKKEWEVMKRLLFFRDTVWDVLDAESLDEESFIGNWITFTSHWKQFCTVLQASGDTVISVNESMAIIDEVCVQKNLYWSLSCLLRYGARQLVLSHRPVAQLNISICSGMEKLEDFIHSLSLSEQMKIKTNVLFQEKMKMVADALCTLQWIDSHFDEGQDLLRTLASIPPVIQQEYEGYQKKLTSQIKEAEEVQAEMEEDAQKQKRNAARDELLWLEYSATSLIPLHDHVGLLHETNAIGQLYHFLFCQMQHAKDSKIPVPSTEEADMLFSNLREFLRIQGKGSRPPMDIVPYKHLVWASEGHASADMIVSTLDTSLEKLPGLWQQLLFQYHSRVWKNSYSKPISLIHAASQQKNQHALPSSDAEYLRMFSTIESGSYRQHIGPSQLHQAIQSHLGFHLNSSLSLLPLHYRDEKVSQLEALQKHFESVFIPSTNQTEWLQLFHSFVYVLHCQFIPLQHKLEESNLLQRLHAHWVKLYQAIHNHDAIGFKDELLRLESLTIEKIQETEFLSAAEGILPSIFEIFGRYFAIQEENSLQTISIHEIHARAKLWVYIGLLQFVLLVPNTNIDPTSKYVVKVKAYRRLISQLDIEIETRKFSQFLQTGSTTGSVIVRLEEEMAVLVEKANGLQEKITLRPEPPQFRALFDDIQQLRTHLVSKDKIQELVLVLCTFQGVEREAMWQDRTMEFIRSITKKYPSYTDITLPLANAIYQMKYGLRLIASQTARMNNSAHSFSSPISYASSKAEFERIIILLIQLPSVITSIGSMDTQKRIDVMEELLSEHSITIIDAFLSDKESSECYSHYLQSLLASSYNLVAVMRGQLPERIMKLLHRLCSIFTATWHRMKKEEKQRKLEEDSLFKYKEKTHDTGETEEEEDERHIRELFPDYSDSFHDLDITNEEHVDEEGNVEKKEEETPENQNRLLESSPTLGDNECWFLYEAHQRIFSLSKEEQTEEGKFSSLDSETLREFQRKEFLLSYETSSKLFQQILDQIPSSSIDQHSAGSHLVAAHLVKKLLTAPPPSEPTDKPVSPTQYFTDNTIYNIHVDPNISEAQLLRKPLAAFQHTIENLLVQWPEHPVLQQLVLIIQRVLSLPVYSPLMKFVSGLELLLRKAHEWETYAHTKISLRDNMTEIALLIARWRKIELRSWPDILATRVKNYESKAVIWWFDLYQTIILSIDSAKVSTEEKQEEYLSELLKTLTDFAQSSNMGEFSVRMKLLNSFANQLSYSLPKDATENSLTRNVYYLLKNLHEYYMQYWNGFVQFVEDSKRPIQEQVMNYVKLAKWEKLEYYMLKDVAQRSHKKLSLFARNFEKILRTPIARLFDSSEESYLAPTIQEVRPKDYIMSKILPNKKPRSKAGKRRRGKKGQKELPVTPSITMKEIKSHIPSDVHALLYLEKTADQDISYQHSKFLSLSKNLQKIDTNSFYGDQKDEGRRELFMFLDQIAAGMINAVEKFRKPEKSQNQKQLAVTSYIRSFREMGISFHMKVMFPNQGDIGTLLQLPPLLLDNLFDFTVSLSPTMYVEKSEMNQYWTLASKYYFKNLTRVKKLRELATNPPARDLTNRQITIACGYIEHFFALGLYQRRFLGTVNATFLRFRKYCSSFASVTFPFDSQPSPFPSHILTKQLITKHELLVDEWIISLGKLSLLFEATIDDSAITQNIQNYQHTILQVKQKSHAFQMILQDSTVNYMITSQQYFQLQGQLAEIENMGHDLKEKIESQEKSTCIDLACEVVCALLQQTEETNLLFSIPQVQCNNPLSRKQELEISPFFDCLDFATKHVLFAVQRLLPVLCKVDALLLHIPEEKEEEEAGEENTDALPEHEEIEDSDPIRVPDVQELLFSCFEVIKMEELNEKLHSLSCAMTLLCNECQRDSEKDRNLLTYCQGFLYQFGILLQQFEGMTRKLLFHLITWHKGTMKLTYVASGVISTLLYQGFCKPPDSDGEEGDTCEDASGTGLGSGEGQKDISEQIEDEEQLHKPERDEQQEQVEEQENGVETAQDFDSELADVKPQEEQERNDSDSEEEAEEPELDKEMGEVDREQEEVLDEQLWNSDDEDETPEEKEGEGSTVQSEQIEDELMANEKEGEGKEEGTEDQQSEEEDSKPELDNGSDEELDGEGSEEDSDQMDGDMIDIQDDEDRSQFDELEPENDFELPSEMDLDLDDLDDEEEANGGEEEEGEGEGSDADEGEGSEGASGDEMETDALDDEAEEDSEEEANAEEGKAQEGAEGEEEEEGAKEEEESTLTKDSAENEYDEDTLDEQIGVRDNTGQDSNVDMADQQENSLEQENAMEQEETLSNATQQSSDSQGGWTDQRQEDVKNDEEKPKQENPQSDPNPYRSLGDASKEWEERVKMIQDAPPSSEEKKEGTKEEESAEKEFEFKNEGEQEQEDDKQALGLATEEQAQQVAKSEVEEEEEEGEGKGEEELEKEFEMDATNDPMDETPPMNTTEELLAISSRTAQGQGQEAEMEEMEEIEEMEEKGSQNAINEEDKTEADPERHDQPMINRSILDEEEEEEMKGEKEEAVPLTQAEMIELRKQLEEKLSEWRKNPEEIEMAQQLWSHYEELAEAPSQELCEQLRLILEPTMATKLRGDYRSGKRINMKKVIPYIASQFRKDKIWLRRTKPNKRHYQVMVAIDDSESMSLNHAGPLACEAMTMIAKSLTQLEVGELAILKFGEDIQLVHPFDQPFTDAIGPQVISQFTFNQKGTNVLRLLDNTVQLLDQARMQSHSQTEHVQLVFIISDGRLSNKKGLGRWIREAEKKRMLIVFIIIDSPNSKDSILQLETVSFYKKKIVRNLYMDDFPFPYYVILHDMNNLSDVLADTLRQWFELSQ